MGNKNGYNGGVTPTTGQRLAESITKHMGSWRFIVIQSVIMAIWIVLNILGIMFHWDPYPFILLNLILSLQAAYAGPIILMAQNRQIEIDRDILHEELELEQAMKKEIDGLHQKLDSVLKKLDK
jgi:uncharacterized membrane protein